MKINDGVNFYTINGIEKNKTDKKNTEDSVFNKMITETLDKVNKSQINANDSMVKMIKGEDINMHQVMISMQESQISMQMIVEMRNKLVDAYKELNSISL